MIRIFIDANALLRFYDSNRSEYKKLIASLEAFADHFYITRQVADEVIRNRLNIAAQAARNVEKELQNISKISLPEHFDVPESKENITAKEWNEQLLAFREEHKRLLTSLHTYFLAFLNSVSEGSDAVSVTLGKLFNRAIEPTTLQLAEAYDRKRLGHPPGKKSDPVGDELNWILVRDVHTKEDELWIVTNDSDYYEKFGNRLYLNPYLCTELTTKFGMRPTISIFSELSDAVRQLQKRLQEEVISEETLDKAQEESASFSLLSHCPVNDRLPPRCPQCGAYNSLAPGRFHSSDIGGWTLWYFCTRCGFRLDSGEPYDD